MENKKLEKEIAKYEKIIAKLETNSEKAINKRDEKLDKLEQKILTLKDKINSKNEKIKDMQENSQEIKKELREVKVQLNEFIAKENEVIKEGKIIRIKNTLKIDLNDIKQMINENHILNLIEKEGKVTKGSLIKVTKMNAMLRDEKTRKVELFKYFERNPFSKFDFKNAESLSIATSTFNKMVNESDEEILKRLKSVNRVNQNAKNSDDKEKAKTYKSELEGLNVAINERKNLVLSNKNGFIFIELD